MVRVRVTLAVVIVVALGVGATAQPSGADAVEDEAESLARAGKFLDAAAKYRAAYALDSRPDLLCNVGVAYYKADDMPRAQLYLGQCLTQSGSLDADFATQVRNVLGVVDEKLRAGDFAPVRITVVPDNASFTVSAYGADEKQIGNKLIWLPYGTHTLEVSAEGYVTKSETVEVAGHVEIAKAIELERAPVVDPNAGRHPGPVPPAHRSRKPAMITTIATVVVGGSALGMYLWARSFASDAGKTDDIDLYNKLVDKAKTRQKVSWALGGLAAVGAGISTYLWIKSGKSEPPVEVTPTADGGAAVWLSGSF